MQIPTSSCAHFSTFQLVRPQHADVGDRRRGHDHIRNLTRACKTDDTLQKEPEEVLLSNANANSPREESGLAGCVDCPIAEWMANMSGNGTVWHANQSGLNCVDDW